MIGNFSILTDFKNKMQDGVLLLDNGICFEGLVLSQDSNQNCFGEICFNTSVTGYQEILSDPSYYGQIIVYTFPHIGNVGCNFEDIESFKYLSQRLQPKGIVLRNLPTNYSNHRGMQSLLEFCLKNNFVVFIGSDTRFVTQQISLKNLKNGNAVIAPRKLGDESAIFEIYKKLLDQKSMDGMELSANVYEKNPNDFFENGKFSNSITKRDWARNLAVIDFGIKENILKLLEEVGFDIHVFPHDVDYKDIKNFDAFFLSNGPGDPRETYKICKNTVDAITKSKKPTFGICLGHQILALSLGCNIIKMPQGHRGANQPVKNLISGLIEITSQNHGFAICEKSIPSDIIITHVSLFDGVIEGFTNRAKNIIAIQYHPESSPGPHDSRYLFKQFKDIVV